MPDETDRAHMAHALALAERGRGTTRPNPIVGCVIVRDGAVVGEGWHERPGGPHAEVAALAAAGDAARGATAYVTLEPCDHHGRTGPCTGAILEAGIARVVYALPDPNALAAGGHDRLAAAGVAVEGGLLSDWAAAQNAPFVTASRLGQPHVTLKLAQTVDGALAVEGRRWLTGPIARRAVHRMRRQADAVLVGVGTVLADDPRLDVRHVAAAPGEQPRPVVIDSRGRTPGDAAVVRDGTVVLTTDASPEDWRERLRADGVTVLAVKADPGDQVDLTAALTALHELGVQEVLAEPGARLAGALVTAGLVDRLVVHVAVSVVGPGGVPRLTPSATPPPGASWRWRPDRNGWLGPDLETVLVRDPARSA